MARKPTTEKLIHCNACGEDYSSTYRRCPFCGERVNARPGSSSDDDYDDGYVFDGQDLFDEPEGEEGAPAGGRRLAGTAKRGRFDSTPISNWPRLITYAISLVIIIAALVIVFTVFYPMIHSSKDPMGGNTSDPNPGVSDSVPPSDEPSDPVDQPTDPVDQPTDPVDEPTDPVVAAGPTSVKLSSYDFTLKEKESYTIKVTLDPADWNGELVWTSSDESYATVDANGKVTNVNATTSLRRVIITVTAGNISESCTVYCRGVTAVENPPDVNTDPVDPSEQPSERADLVPGTEGYIVGASGGLRIRSGPGTTYSVQASLVNGNKVTILEDAGDGWYRISYGGGNTGYIMGEFIAVN